MNAEDDTASDAAGQSLTVARDGARDEDAEAVEEAVEAEEEVVWPYRWMGPFLLALTRLGNVSSAARAAGISRARAYGVRDESDAFAKAWEAAVEEAVDLLEQEAWRRATVGTTRVERKLVANEKGELVVVEERQVPVVSDHLLTLLLGAHRPEKYRPRQRLEHTGKDGGPIESEVTERKVEDARDRLRAEVLRLAPAEGAGGGASGSG